MAVPSPRLFDPHGVGCASFRAIGPRNDPGSGDPGTYCWRSPSGSKLLHYLNRPIRILSSPGLAANCCLLTVEMQQLLQWRSRLNFWPASRLHWAAGGSERREIRVIALRQQRLEHFNEHVFGHVEGWLGDRMWQIINAIGSIFDHNGVHGNIAEFGVHHGLFLFLLNSIRNDNEEWFAIDVFDNPKLNIDHSGHGSLAVFLSHVETLMASDRRLFRIVQRA